MVLPLALCVGTATVAATEQLGSSARYVFELNVRNSEKFSGAPVEDGFARPYGTILPPKAYLSRMDPDSRHSERLAFGRFAVVPHQRELLVDGHAVKLGGRAFAF